jgi:Flp pilus assembly protein TadG
MSSIGPVSAPHRHVRGQRRQTRRQRQRRERGQTLVIFALSLTVLLGLAGLTIDVARAYDLFARMQRAAEAGALAGVLYIPTYYNTVRPGDIDSAISRASKEVVKNGFGSALAPTASACSAGLVVQICLVSSKPGDLRVTITETLQVVLLSGLGVQPVTLAASAQAEYLPPVQLGSRQNYFGDEVECSASSPPNPATATACDVGASGTHLQYFMATMNGPAELKENGDPMVYCEEGSANTGAVDPSGTPYTVYNSFTTNHPQWSSSGAAIQQHCGPPVTGGKAGNPDQQPIGFDGPATTGSAHPGGYNYAVIVPAGISTASLWVFNPTFIPGGAIFSGPGLDGFFHDYSSMHDPFGGGLTAISGGHYDAPPLYFTMTYTLYKVSNLFDRGNDTLQVSTAYPPYDAASADLSAHSCSSGQVYDPYYAGGASANSYHGTISPTTGCFTLAPKTAGTGSPWQTGAPAPCWLQWCMLASNLAAGTYRLVVEDTGLNSDVAEYTSNAQDGWGTHYYALKVCSTSNTSDPIGADCKTGAGGGSPGVSLFGWNNMEVNFTTTLSQATPDPTNPATSCVTQNTTAYTCVDLGCLPSAYAGRLATLGLFDPGDGGGGDIYIGVVPPAGSGATVTYPSWVTTTRIDGDAVVQAHFNSPNYNQLNGLWVTTTLHIPSAYTGNCNPGPGGTGWWQLVYASGNGGQPTDWVGVSLSLVGSPIHLVPALG